MLKYHTDPTSVSKCGMAFILDLSTSLELLRDTSKNEVGFIVSW